MCEFCGSGDDCSVCGRGLIPVPVCAERNAQDRAGRAISGRDRSGYPAGLAPLPVAALVVLGASGGMLALVIAAILTR